MPNSYNGQLPTGFLNVAHAATLSSTHPGVFLEQGGKAIRVTSEQGYLCCGLYCENYPQRPLQAMFSLLIDNNTADDQYILFVDIYDHRSQRVVGKRLITRKNFPKANERCLFAVDFTPPSPQANMEARVLYMGHSYVRLDKIAIIDPAKTAVTQPADIPDLIEGDNPQPGHSQDSAAPHSETETEQANFGLPSPWKVCRIGRGDGTVKLERLVTSDVDTHKGELHYDIEITAQTQGKFGGGSDDLFFVYQPWTPDSRNGKVAMIVLKRDGDVGIMFRETLDPDSKFIMQKDNYVVCRKKAGGGVTQERILEGSKTARGYKLFRKDKGSDQYFIASFSAQPSRDSGDIGGQKGIRFELPQNVYVGLALGTATARIDLEIKYKDKSYVTT